MDGHGGNEKKKEEKKGGRWHIWVSAAAPLRPLLSVWCGKWGYDNNGALE